ncbi:uncharacterized protein PV06_10084 [Exophiala oligosperma]|uniref:Zn(2)-C6 fungal-type domain-containing protein n=1 Tax=Exophiala oligosperma TaxID=215243 RepID=A0A0D2DQQ6_9EURO|nr:uncharacterized protein PV06_10084 [Exophiala oligosperma]KIW38124.1 hypothetical protein PV06_10084 [Exophiala oligosperma]
MFFIVPDCKNPNGGDSSTAPGSSSSPSESQKRQRTLPEEDEVAGYYPRRNQKACDRCRLKKARCSGGKICEKCKRDGVICTTNRESKRDPTTKPPNAEYVHLVESQRDALLSALRTIYEKDASKDSAILSDVLKDLGIGVEDLKRLPRKTSSSEEQVDFNDIDLQRNAAEIQALLTEWNIPITQPPMSTEFAISTPIQSTQPLQMNNDCMPLVMDFQNFAPAASTGPAVGQMDAIALPASTNEFDDWLVTDKFGDNWSLPGSGPPKG